MRRWGGKNGSKLFIFLLAENNKLSERKPEKKTSELVGSGSACLENVCQCVSPDWGKKCFPPAYYIPLLYINWRAKNNLLHIQSVSTSDSHKAGRRPLASTNVYQRSLCDVSGRYADNWNRLRNHKDISRSLSTFVNSGQPVTRWFCQHGTDEAGGGRSDRPRDRSNYVFIFPLLCFFFAHSNHISVFLFAFWGLIHLFTAQGVYSPLWPYCVGHMTHADWTRCQSRRKPFVIFSLHHAQFMSPSRHLNESGEKKGGT